jgi:hypothetical protein
MSSQRAQQILYESEAALRLVDNELSRLRGADQDDVITADVETEYPQLVESANEQLLAVIAQIRRSRMSSANRLRAHVAAEADSSEETLAEIEERLMAVTRLFESSMSADTARSEDRSNA